MIVTAVVVITTAMTGTAAQASPHQAAGPVPRSATGLLPPVPRTAPAGPTNAKCDAGSFCAWGEANFTGKAARLNLETANPNQCVPLPDGLVAKSLVNAMTKDVSVYEGVRCSTEAEFTTYPKGGVYVPNAPFVVRAIQVWE
jgi:hypothetical protein